MASIQFISGFDEEVVPDINLTRSRDGSTGTATFRFANPKVLESSSTDQGEITGMFLVDEEGKLVTRDVNALFINGKPQAIEAVYVIKNPDDWDRFMRFMERYAKDNNLTFTKAT
uniref:Photosystem II reaction center Psb28 protein n=1 Tax=Rhodochaete parvula TaxID=110510 RepID=A0A1C9CI90_9RHOD|nr:photosystem II protein W [Rhodochaete parvula]ARO91291.1 photosystem II reaction center protein W [Rhodochaete parvula]|eukprot:Plantae.Rhodophyta-Rhodochaete_pulchella.ctg19131.p2 GENE.Plantae.Rhodophyta-Rhodochaete_pulchella.ctg19131~~Plantae.Rhodophyta-Rhodochaete_pulchella.ctg19131.p2  ORF type:complete len:115 (+),score=7.63 Plantae.Rhodophyta-Rhodochaete_pulchella.ctg19131:652-996(+)